MKILDLKMYLDKLKETRTPVLTMCLFNDKNVREIFDSFSCQHCGNCCTALSNISVNNSHEIARYLRMGHRKFKKKYMKKGEFIKPCPFHSKERCDIYQVRPYICRQYPIIKIDDLIGLATSCPAMEDLCLEVLQNRLISLRHL